VLRFGNIPTAETYVVAKANGFFEQYAEDVGATVEYSEFAAGKDAINAIIGNSIDFTCLGSSPIMAAAAQGLDLRLVYVAAGVLGSEGLAVKTSAGINAVEDLSGKTIGVVFNSTSHYMVQALIDFYEIADVELVNLSPSALVAAWSQGSIDAGFIWQPVLQELLDDGGELLIDVGQIKEASDGQYGVTDLCITTEAFAAEHPDLVSAFVKANDAAAKLINDDVDAAAESSWQDLGVPDAATARDLYSANTFPIATDQVTEDWFGTADSPGALLNELAGVWNFLHDTGSVSSEADPDLIQELFLTTTLEEVAEQCGSSLTDYDC
jgi:taurine transport system substrate-binding protein